MATFTFFGFVIESLGGGTYQFVERSNIETVWSNEQDPVITYSLLNVTNGLPAVAVDQTFSEARVGGTSLNLDPIFSQSGDEERFGQIEWDDNGTAKTTVMYTLFDAEAGYVYLFAVGGDRLPSIFSDAEFQAWDSTITGFFGASSPFAPGDEIDLFSNRFNAFSLDDLFNAPATGASFDGGWGDDILFGNDAADSLQGGDDDDLLYGRQSNDTLEGDAGEDTIFGGQGNDLINGGSDHDTLRGEAGSDRMFGGSGNDEMWGGWFSDWMYGQAGNDTMRGEGGLDRMFGGTGNDAMFGGANDDKLFGANQDDFLGGGSGNDTLNGEGGRDILSGDGGNDQLTGGWFSDRFVFRDGFGLDVITDFDPNNINEKIDLRNVTAITDLTDLYTNHMFQVGADVEIRDLLGNVITVQNVTEASLQDGNDFLI